MIYIDILYLSMIALAVGACVVEGLMDWNKWMYVISPEEQLRAMDHWRQVKAQSSDVKRVRHV